MNEYIINQTSWTASHTLYDTVPNSFGPTSGEIVVAVVAAMLLLVVCWVVFKETRRQ